MQQRLYLGNRTLSACYKFIFEIGHYYHNLQSLGLKVHFGVSRCFLPEYFITLLFSLTCVLTITRRKGPTSGFQSSFYTLLIICVPPIILGQVLRYFRTVIAIHMNSYVTSYDPCADAIEWNTAKIKMEKFEHVKRPRVLRHKRLISSATKREKSENDAKCNSSRINIGEEFGRWTDLKNLFRLKTHAEVGTILLDR